MAEPTPIRSRSGRRPAESPSTKRIAKPDPADASVMQKLPFPWSPRARGVASVLILIHWTAAFVAALVAAPPYSELSSAVAEVFRPYVNAADLNHGYRFFSPDP